MKRTLITTVASLAIAAAVFAQGPRSHELGASPQAVGEAGVAWYTTWDTALAEANRSNRPIFFMSAVATCRGISGVF
jgi:hypothetical protein